MTARRASPESDLQEAAAELLDRILAPCVEWSAFPAGHVYLNAAAAAKLTRIGLKRSWPDLLILHRVLHGIELKAGAGALSRTRLVRTRRLGRMRLVDGQREVFPRLEAAGAKIAVCRSLDEIMAQLRAWEIPTILAAAGAA